MSRLHDLAASALRTLDPEDAHRLTVRALALGLGPGAPAPDPILATTIAGLSLSSAVGLAAGFDKNAEFFAPMLAAGFGFVECGTVTPLPQAGNPRPRLFRLTDDQAVINRMGFNNQGLEAFAGRLARPGRPGPVGANIGANKDSADRIGDYVTGLKRLWGLADWFTLNVSSPNTPGLRALQTRAALEELLGRTAEARDALPTRGHVPLFLKVAPDLDDPEIEAIVLKGGEKLDEYKGMVIGLTRRAERVAGVIIGKEREVDSMSAQLAALREQAAFLRRNIDETKANQELLKDSRANQKVLEELSRSSGNFDKVTALLKSIIDAIE